MPLYGPSVTAVSSAIPAVAFCVAKNAPISRMSCGVRFCTNGTIATAAPELRWPLAIRAICWAT